MLSNRNYRIKESALVLVCFLLASCSQANSGSKGGDTNPSPSPGALSGAAVIVNESQGTVQGGAVTCNQANCQGEAVFK